MEEQKDLELTVESEVKAAEPQVAAPAQKEAAPKAEPAAAPKAHKRFLQGKVVSDKTNKTIIVKVERQVAHPLYKKYYKRSKRVMAHDQNNDCKVGDTVRIRECRPLSALKRWELFEIVERAK